MNKLYPALIVSTFVISLTFGLINQAKPDAEALYQNTLREYVALERQIAKEKREAYIASLTPWQRFKEEAIRLSKVHGFDPKVPIAQCALESAHGTSYFAVNRNNFCGIAAYDSNPDAALSFETPEACANYWVLLMSKRYKSAWEKRHDAYQMLVEIKRGGYASSATYITKVSSMPEFTEL